MKPQYLALLLIAALAFTSCSKTRCDKPSQCNPQTAMVLHNYTGLDGCGWVLEDSSQVYEPINLGDFNISLREGSTVYVDFDLVTDRASICMVGPMIKINCIETGTGSAY